ncbi:MAG: helix-turn-helix domain-containing protein [Armatimonadota bacterium]|jgi:transcriptional regulator with XRE-family HTH domain
MSLSERIGSNIRRRRKELGLTQEQVGEKAGLDWTTIGAAERGVRNLSVESLLKVATALGVTVGDLVESPKREPTEQERALHRLTYLLQDASVDDIVLVTEIARLVLKR